MKLKNQLNSIAWTRNKLRNQPDKNCAIPSFWGPISLVQSWSFNIAIKCMDYCVCCHCRMNRRARQKRNIYQTTRIRYVTSIVVIVLCCIINGDKKRRYQLICSHILATFGNWMKSTAYKTISCFHCSFFKWNMSTLWIWTDTRWHSSVDYH